jgi:hypothetical protein
MDEFWPEPKESEHKKGFDGLRSKVHFDNDIYEDAIFSITDLWLDQATIPDLWNNGVLGNHLTPDPFAHDWVIVKDESFMECKKPGFGCMINLRFKRDFETDDQRDH